MSTRNVCGGDSVSQFVTDNFAAVFAMPLPRMFACALIVRRVVLRSLDRLVSKRSEMRLISSMWRWQCLELPFVRLVVWCRIA